MKFTTKPNHLATREERLMPATTLPKPLLEYFAYHQALTEDFCATLKTLLGDGVALCTVVRLHQNELIISVSSQTLANHLKYLNETILATLHLHPKFASVQVLQVVYLPPITS